MSVTDQEMEKDLRQGKAGRDKSLIYLSIIVLAVLPLALGWLSGAFGS